MKLGLKIEITSQGAGAAKTYNSTPALEKYASASRSIIKDAFPAREDLRQKGLDFKRSLDESGRSVTFLRFLGQLGYLICIFQARPENSGRPYDGAAAWIHVPASVFLTGPETENLIDEVDAALSNERGIDYSRLETIFSKDYSEKNQMPAIASIGSNGEFSAVRYYGNGTDYQLSELLGNGIAQSEYGKFKAIFFLRKSENLAFSGKEITSTLVPTCVIEPPTQKAGFAPYLENKSPFSLPIEIPVGSPIKIVWKRQGYKDIPKVINANDYNTENSNRVFAFSNSDVMFAVYRQNFHVHSDNETLNQCRIQVDNKLLDDVVYLPESKRGTKVCIKVTADGFIPFQKDILLSSKIDIPMQRVTHHYEFTIPMYDGNNRLEDDGKVILETYSVITKCPVKGYSLRDEDYIKEGEGKENVNHLEKGGVLEKIKHFAYGFVSCLIILSVCGAGWCLFDKYELNFGWPLFKAKQEAHSQDSSDGSNSATTQLSAEKEHAKAIKYLNSTTTWDFKIIKDFKCLDGLFEDLNDFKLDKIVGKWNSELKGVPEFEKVVEAAENAMDKKWNVQGEHQPSYKQKGDSLINIPKYAEWLSKDLTPKQEASKPQSSADHIKSVATPFDKKQSSTNKPTTTAESNNKGKRGDSIINTGVYENNN